MYREAGMYYYGARYYDSRISIFVSVDPLAEQTMTPYQYVYNNPVNLIDPTGMAPEDFRVLIQRDRKGNIITITLQTTVYLQGKGASQGLADRMNKSFNEKFSGFKSLNGVNIGIDALYVYDGNNSRSQNNLKSGENILNVRTDMKAEESSFVLTRGYNPEDKL